MPLKIGSNGYKIKKTIIFPSAPKFKDKMVGKFFTDRVMTEKSMLALPFLTNNYVFYLDLVIVLYSRFDILKNNKIFAESQEDPESNIWCYDGLGALIWKVASLGDGKYYVRVEYRQTKDLIVVLDNLGSIYQLNEKSGEVAKI